MLKYLIVFLCMASPAAADCVILLHGLARGSGTWMRMEPALEQAGHIVINQEYPSTDQPIEVLANTALPGALSACPKGHTVHVVTHSMGGIILRQYLSDKSIPDFGRAVMLAPPNHGSEIVDTLGDLAAFGWINGPAGRQLGTGDDSIPNQLGRANFPVGIIAGTVSMNPVFSKTIPGVDDGKVSVASTHLDGMADHIEVAASHTFISFHDDVIDHVTAFLETGAFARR